MGYLGGFVYIRAIMTICIGTNLHLHRPAPPNLGVAPWQLNVNARENCRHIGHPVALAARVAETDAEV